MDIDEINKIKSEIKQNVNINLFKEPFSILKTYGKDDGKNRYRHMGRDPISAHLTQNVDYSKVEIEYKFYSIFKIE